MKMKGGWWGEEEMDKKKDISECNPSINTTYTTKESSKQDAKKQLSTNWVLHALDYDTSDLRVAFIYTSID